VLRAHRSKGVRQTTATCPFRHTTLSVLADQHDPDHGIDAAARFAMAQQSGRQNHNGLVPQELAALIAAAGLLPSGVHVAAPCCDKARARCGAIHRGISRSST
jgi:hypothetical protein